MPVQKHISKAALLNNYHYLERICPESRIMAVVKNDAYGHGLNAVADALQDVASGYAVADVGEALKLRDLSIEQQILVLQGALNDKQLRDALNARLDLTVHNPAQLKQLEAYHNLHGSDQALSQTTLWIKFDTGMHRLGFDIEQHSDIKNRVNRLGVGAVILMSHLARANEESHYNTYQQQRFDMICSSDDAGSLANSAAALNWPKTHKQWVRSGLALYGIAPANADETHRRALQPVMRVTAPVIALRTVRAGEPIGYGEAYHCPRDMRIAVVAMGYGHGYPYRAREGTPVWLDGQRLSLVGRVSMDMLTVALTPETRVRLGDPVELWGEHVAVNEVAACGETISYDTLCAAKGIPAGS